MSPKIPPEILQTLLNLAELMEHDDKALPMDIRTLGQYATRCHAYAKALHYRIQEPTTPTIESLISINNQLQQNDAALKETWYEKLQRWEDALEAYNRREKDEPNSLDITMGKMRCLHALGEWDLLSQLAHAKWINSNNEIRRSIAPLAAAAAWGLGQWDRMAQYINVMKVESPDRSFFHAILSLRRNHFEDAATHIVKARDLLITELAALVGESYNRAYGVVVRVQMLSELEEIITYRMAADDHELQRVMRKTWTKRLKGCQRNVDIWQRMLKVRALVVKPRQGMDMWIKFANLCRKSGRMGLAEKSLNSLVDDPDPSDLANSSSTSYAGRAPPQVVYAQLKYMWATGNQKEALNHLCDFTSKMSQDLGLNTNDLMTEPLPSELVVSASLTNIPMVNGSGSVNGSSALVNAMESEDFNSILRSYLLATYFDKGWYKAWHNWAFANFEVVTSTDKADSKDRGDAISNELVDKYVLPAIQGLFKSIYLSSGNSLQDTSRLLTLWFRYGGLPEPATAMNEGFTTVSIDTWLEVIPQLIARIHQPNPIVRKSLHTLLSDLGRAHPQALVYPLTVAIKSDSHTRQMAAAAIMEKIRSHSATLVKQAEIVVQELIRVAVLWHEQWHEDKYPQKVPFRLTRMLTYAMEVSGIEGSFRITCGNVMRVLRDNKESLMAILEAFAHDPLINWGFNLPQPDRPSQALGGPYPTDGASRNSTINIAGNVSGSMSNSERKASIIGVSPSGLDRRRPQFDEAEVVNLELQNQLDSRNARATVVLKRISDKLTGHDFKQPKELDVPHQVDKLIQQATSVENLCQHYIEWCSFSSVMLDDVLADSFVVDIDSPTSIRIVFWNSK
ncbi:FAT domain-containing protein [Lipomyces starkeyi]